MADPAKLLVIQNVVTALQGITRQAGYNLTVRNDCVTTEPVNLLAINVTDVPFFVVAEDTRGTRTFHPSKRVRETIALLITARVDAADTDGADRKIKAASWAAADVERALMADITRGGVAFLTLVQSPEPMLTGVGAQNIVLVAIPVDVTLLRVAGQS